MPLSLVGKLIGQRGSFLQGVRNKTDVKVTIKRVPSMKDHKLCILEGSQEGIIKALTLIRQKFPEKKYPQFTLEEISLPSTPQESLWISGMMNLSLIEGVNNDVSVCFIVKPNRFFIHLPTHPTYPSLRILDENITQLYNSTESPPIPEELSSKFFFQFYDPCTF